MGAWSQARINTLTFGSCVIIPQLHVIDTACPRTLYCIMYCQKCFKVYNYILYAFIGRHVQKKRYFQGIDFEEGYPNLVVTSSGMYNIKLLVCYILYALYTIIELVLTCTLMLYAEGNEMPLPTQEEVLICTPQTTAEEVRTLLQNVFLIKYPLGHIAMEKSNK